MIKIPRRFLLLKSSVYSSVLLKSLEQVQTWEFYVLNNEFCTEGSVHGAGMGWRTTIRREMGCSVCKSGNGCDLSMQTEGPHESAWKTWLLKIMSLFGKARWTTGFASSKQNLYWVFTIPIGKTKLLILGLLRDLNGLHRWLDDWHKEEILHVDGPEPVFTSSVSAPVLSLQRERKMFSQPQPNTYEATIYRTAAIQTHEKTKWDVPFLFHALHHGIKAIGLFLRMWAFSRAHLQHIWLSCFRRYNVTICS